MKIRLAKEDDLDQVLKVLNNVTIDLHKRGINQWPYPWNPGFIKNSITNKHCYVLLFDEQVIGIFCMSNINVLSELPVEPQSMYLSKIAILPEFQGRNIGCNITDFARSFAQRLNKTLYLDCWAGNEKLREFYFNNGFKFIGNFPEADYIISVFKYN